MSSARSIAAMASLPQTSCCWETATGLSLTLDPCFPDHLAPARVVLPDGAVEFGWRVGLDHDALRGELGLELRRVQHLHHVGVDPLHDLRGRFRRNEQAEPGIERVARHGLADGGRVAEIRKARGRAARQELELAL